MRVAVCRHPRAPSPPAPPVPPPPPPPRCRHARKKNNPRINRKVSLRHLVSGHCHAATGCQVGKAHFQNLSRHASVAQIFQNLLRRKTGIYLKNSTASSLNINTTLDTTLQRPKPKSWFRDLPLNAKPYKAHNHKKHQTKGSKCPNSRVSRFKNHSEYGFWGLRLGPSGQAKTKSRLSRKLCVVVACDDDEAVH